jgi:hypothetical protein
MPPAALNFVRRRAAMDRVSALRSLGAFLLLASSDPAGAALTAYGVTGNGNLFRFDPDSPGTATTIGNMGITPDAIDFRPLAPGETDPVLYAIDVGPVIAQLYTVDRTTAAVTSVGPGFPTVGAGYSLLDATIGFDFNPRTLQADNSQLIRLVAGNGTNLRLNSDTGGVAAVDVMLAFAGAGGAPRVDAVAYINNNVATTAAGGTTALYDLDHGEDDLYTQNPPNNGTLNSVGAFGVTIDGDPNMAFDIYTDPFSIDETIGGDRGLAVFRRGGAYMLYDVDLANGATTGGRLVDGGIDFTGGFAVAPDPIPEPGVLAMGLLTMGASMRRGRASLPAQNPDS